MKRRILAPVAAVLTSIGALLVLLALLGSPNLAAAPAALTVTAVEPSAIPNDRDTSVVITGTGFTAELSGTQVITPPTVLLNTTELADVGWVASTTLTSTVPAGFPAGVYTVTVETPDGADGSLPDALTVRYPAPELEAVSPLSGTYGQTMALTVTGTHVVPTPTVSLGRVPCPEVGVVSSKTLTVTVPGDLLPGIHDLTVRNPGPERPQDVLPGAFTLYSPEPAVTDVEPLEGPNDLDVAIVITGTGFAPTPTARLAGTRLNDVAWVSMTRLTAQVPWGMDPGIYGLTVTNPAPGAFDAALADAFTVTEGVGVWNAGELYGGQVSDILINPETPQRLYAEVQDIGLFRSDDGGATWDFKFAPGADHTAMDPLSPDRLYVFGRPRADGDLWRTDDGGESWIPLTTTYPITQTSGRDCWEREKVYPISGTVYASACGGDGDFSGVISSTNHGKTWEPAIEGLTDTQVTDLAFHPTDSLTMYAGTANGNVFITHNGGASWTFAARPVSYVHELDVNPFGGDRVWVVADTFMYGGEPAVLKSTDASATGWVSMPPTVAHTNFIDDFFAFAPGTWGETYSETVFVSSGYKTHNGGESWTSFGPESAHVYDYIYAFTPHPTDTQTLYAAVTGAGVYKTTDGGTSWRVANQGLTGIVPDRLHPVPDRPDTLYTLDQKRIGAYKATQGGAVWQELPVTGTTSLLVDPVTTTRVYAAWQDAIVRISSDGGRTWPASHRIVPEPPPGEGYSVNVMKANPDQPGELLAGLSHTGEGYDTETGEVYRSTDGGQTWTQGKVEPSIGVVQDIAYDPISPTIVYAATGHAGDEGTPLIKSPDGGTTWVSLGITGVTAVAVKPGSHQVFIPSHDVCGGVGSGLCVSDDGGERWTATGGAIGGTANFIFTPGDSPILYAATRGGLARSVDDGQSWSEAAGLLGEIPVYAVAAVEAEDRIVLYAATTGGYVGDGGTASAQASPLTSPANDLANAGVYRYTTRRAREVYLPVVLRSTS